MKFRIFQPLAIQQLGSRSNQEDSIYPLLGEATANDRLFILCDGMGGHESGEIASSTVCKTISNYILSHYDGHGPLNDDLLEGALTAAYAAVDEQDPTGQKKMGTTLTFLCLHQGGCTVAHIGDSRIYHLRPATNEILYRSRDHSLVYDLFEVGELSQEELKTAKNKNVITRVIMAHQERPSKADIVHITDIEPGDYFYLCSDGMLEQMDDKGLMEVFTSDKSEEQKRSILIGETVDNADNHSAYIIRIESVEREEGDSSLPNNEAAARSANKVLMAELSPMPAPPPLPNTAEEAGEDDDVQVVVGNPVPSEPAYHQQPMAPTTPPRTKKGGHTFIIMAIVFFFVVLAAVAAVFFFLNNKEESRPIRITHTPTERQITRENMDDDNDRRSVARPQQQNQQTAPVRRQDKPTTTPPKVNTPSRNNSDPNKTNSSGSSTTKPQGGKPQGGESSGGQQNSEQDVDDDTYINL